MTDDKELLELAAKAAAMKITVCPLGKTRDTTGAHPSMNLFGMPIWNPLTDDGDAFRLAVKLGIDISTAQVDFYDKHSTDPYAATRRAIVRAAAEIEKSL